MKYCGSFYNIVIRESDTYTHLYNSYSGGIAKLERNVFNLVSNSILDDENKCDHFDALLAQGFIKPVQLDEFNHIVLASLSDFYTEDSSDLSFSLAPTMMCNLECFYCFEKNRKDTKVWSHDDITQIINFIETKFKPTTKNFHASWFGGEPIIAFEAIVQFSRLMIRVCESKGIKYSASIITNGTLLNSEKINILVNECCITNFQLTIDGTESTYCAYKGASAFDYQTVLAAIKHLANKTDAKINVRLNCDKENLDEIKSACKEIIKHCGVTEKIEFYLAKLKDYSDTNEDAFLDQSEFDLLRSDFSSFISQLTNRHNSLELPKYKKRFCGLSRLSNMLIGAYGEIYKCDLDLGNTERVIGHITYGCFFSDFLVDFAIKQDYSACSACKVFPLCLGGCPLRRFDFPKRNDHCEYSLEYIVQLANKYIIDNSQHTRD